MRKLVAFLLVSSASAVRKLGDHDSNRRPPLQRDERIMTQKVKTPDTLKKLGANGADPAAMGTKVAQDINSYDWSEPIGPQLWGTAKDLISIGASAVHPLLGIFISVFAAMFGMGGTGEDEGNWLQEWVVDHVDTVLTARLTDVKMDRILENVVALRDKIDYAKDSPKRWEQLGLHLVGAFSGVFGLCWAADEPTEACTDWRRGGSGADDSKGASVSSGNALVLELEFTQVVALAGFDLCSYGIEFAKVSEYVDRAHAKIVAHLKTFKTYREDKENGAPGGFSWDHECLCRKDGKKNGREFSCSARQYEWCSGRVKDNLKNYYVCHYEWKCDEEFRAVWDTLDEENKNPGGFSDCEEGIKNKILRCKDEAHTNATNALEVLQQKKQNLADIGMKLHDGVIAEAWKENGPNARRRRSRRRYHAPPHW